MEEFKEFMCCVGTVLFGIMAIIVLIVYLFEQRVCYTRAAKMEMQAEYGFFMGCMVKDPKLGWRPLNQRRQVE